jgi:GPI mannosyltransferase 3
MEALRDRFVRAHLIALLAVTCVTAYSSYGYFHPDEYFQVLHLARIKLGQVSSPAVPWEIAAGMRPWMQPAAYVALGKALALVGVRDPFAFAFACRLVTGLVGVATVAVFLAATLPWMKDKDERRAHVRWVTLAGFLPYLLVRTSSETASAAAFTLGYSVMELAGASRQGSVRPRAAFAAGVLFGVAFEMRFQSAFMTVGYVMWLALVARASLRSVAALVAGGVVPVLLAIPIDTWGYGELTFPPVEYAMINLFEGAAVLFGADPPFAYLWASPANVFMPLVLALMACLFVGWWRHRRHALTWITLPFFLVHALLSHKEERFLFPMVLLVLAFPTLAAAPSVGSASRVSAWLWRARRGALSKVVWTTSFAGMALLAVYPLGWNHHVPFQRYVHAHLGGELHAHALEDFDLGIPAFAPRVYDIDKETPSAIAKGLRDGSGKQLLVTDDPRLRTGTDLDARAERVYSELPFAGTALEPVVLAVVDAYNRRAVRPLRPLRFRTLYRLRDGE